MNRSTGQIKKIYALLAVFGLALIGGCAGNLPVAIELGPVPSWPAAPVQEGVTLLAATVMTPAPLAPLEATPALPMSSQPFQQKVSVPETDSGGLLPILMADAGSLAVTSLDAPTDLWDRIRRGFAMPNFESELVRAREQWYSSRPDYLLRMTERSRKYLFHIVEELERRNMPTELALLPFVESAFNPQAVSSAKATGMWQFMPATGRQYELKQNAFRDDRRDVLASTRAALDYLERLYGMFGDWHLALAAYNWGEGNVGRAIAKNLQAGQPGRYGDLGMPMETRFYVPKLQAIKNMVALPAAFGAQLPPIQNHPFFQTVDIKRDIDVALAAKLAEVSLDDFKSLNPSLNQPVILAAGVPQILLPWDNALTFRSNLAAHGESRLASWTVWMAPATMRPADAAKRVGMSEAELRRINNIPPRMVIRAGSSLLVPRDKRVETDVALHVADHGQLSLGPEVTLQRSLVKAGKNDSVASLAKRYRVSPAALAAWNQVSPSTSFKSGQAVVLYLPGSSQAGNAKNTANARKAAKPRTGTTVTAKR
jgi:membrane-bound lytic murein transglycosylase D